MVSRLFSAVAYSVISFVTRYCVFDARRVTQVQFRVPQVVDTLWKGGMWVNMQIYMAHTYLCLTASLCPFVESSFQNFSLTLCCKSKQGGSANVYSNTNRVTLTNKESFKLWVFVCRLSLRRVIGPLMGNLIKEKLNGLYLLPNTFKMTTK
jgi:hypothetical protein